MQTELKESIQYAIHALRDRAEILTQEIEDHTSTYTVDTWPKVLVRDACIKHADVLQKNLKKSK
tara:strand:- start:3227 stop:3418 length:192 start_codon:yes stop_codon:yes gene_type:complete